MSGQRKEEIIERIAIASMSVDALSAVVPLGAVTHLLFTQREPETDGSIYRILQARLVVPTDQLQAIGRALLTGRVVERTTNDHGEEAVVH